MLLSFYDPLGWCNIATYVWFVCVAVLSRSHRFITFDLEPIRCTTMSVPLEWLHVSIHGTTFTEDRASPQKRRARSNWYSCYCC